jgi:apolipoprotein D and lipocalin family protein
MPKKEISSMRFFLLISVLILTSCVAIPESIKLGQNFEVYRYLGKWYEVARLDHSFERG